MEFPSEAALRRRTICRVCLAAALLALFPLAAQAGEPADRKAFVEFLQTNIVSRPGVHIPLMSADTAKSFGDYAQHYQIILDSNRDVEMTAMQKVAELKSKLSTLDDLVAQRDALAALRKALPGMREQFDRQLATANDAHAALRQPDDLKTVYDQAFDRIVARPAALLGAIWSMLDEDLELYPV